MFSSCHVRVSEWTRTLYVPVCQGTPCSKQAQNLKFKWQQLDWNWAFVYKVRGCGFKSSCSQLNFRFCACFEQGLSWHSGNYRVWIHSETRTWHDKNIQSNAPCIYVLTTQLNHLAFWLNVWVFVYAVSGCGFESGCSHLNVMFNFALTLIYVSSVFRNCNLHL